MARWEYRVVPAPTKGLKARGVKGPEARFAHALQTLMNDMGADGWEFQRAETLPSVERSGLTSTTTEWRNMLVFRRSVTEAMEDFEPELLPAPTPAATVTDPDARIEERATDDAAEEDTDEAPTHPGRGATQMLPDNGVEETSDVAGMTTSLQKLANRRSGAEPDD